VGGLGEGDIGWPTIYAALREIGFKGTATVELEGGEAGSLKEICRRLTLILTGELPSGTKSVHG
jgi:sugar phosphate isomerase/epimerase